MRYYLGSVHNTAYRTGMHGLGGKRGAAPYLQNKSIGVIRYSSGSRMFLTLFFPGHTLL